MSRLRLKMAMSLDGYVAGPDQSLQNPLGVGGHRLHEWAFALEIFRKQHHIEGGVVNESTAVLEDVQANIGATIMGRNMFGGGPGPWPSAPPWDGWWGDDPPFHHPVFVLTHHPREPLRLKGRNVFTFVTDGPASALEQARAASHGMDVSLAGGASVARQYLAAGLVEEATIHLVPVLLGSGERLFDGLGTDLHGLRLQRTVAAPGVTHLVLGR